jgi:O-acetyl-ADP-ribose deacetylase (regulator of RNase III)
MKCFAMQHISTVTGDITEQDVDAIVNPASRAVRVGGGVNAAIHRSGGPAIFEEFSRRIPNGIALGEADWTGAGDLSAGWIIHTAAPKYSDTKEDAALLRSCYRRALQIADELGAQSVAIPLIGTGAHGWPLEQAVTIAAQAFMAAETLVEDVRLVAFSRDATEQIDYQLSRWTPLKILQGMRVLHRRGYHQIRAVPGMSGSGFHWRVTVATADNFDGDFSFRDEDAVIRYTTGSLTEFAGGRITGATDPEAVADLIVAFLPNVDPTADDPKYVSWFAGLMQLVEVDSQLPIAYADYFEPDKGWEVGWGSGQRYPHPPTPPLPQTAVEWALSYDPYARLCRRPDVLRDIVNPLEAVYLVSGTIPQWAGVDLLRGWAHLLAEEAVSSSDAQAYERLNAVIAAIDGHPATRPFEHSPLYATSTIESAECNPQVAPATPHTYYPPSLIGWLESYNGYDRLAQSQAISDALNPLVTRFKAQQSIPRWAGPDLLRAWMFNMMEMDSTYEGREQALGRPAFIAALDAVDQHPATLPGERSPLYRG